MPWEKLTPPWKKVPLPWTFFPTASIFCGAAERKNRVLRKKYHVVRKKNHVVRKLFYVASIFSYAKGRFTCGAARGPHGLPRAESGAAAPICCKDVLAQAVRRRRHNQVRKNRFHHRVTLKYEYFRTFACPTTQARRKEDRRRGCRLLIISIHIHSYHPIFPTPRRPLGSSALSR